MRSFLSSSGAPSGGRIFSARSTNKHVEFSDSAVSPPGTPFSATSSLTPPTSPADSARESADRTVKTQAKRRSSQRLQQAPSSVRTYNDNVLSGISRRSRKGGMNPDLKLPDESPTDEDFDPSKQLILETERALERESHVDDLPVNDLRVPSEELNRLRRRRSTHLEELGKATDLDDSSNGVLGRTRRKTLDAGLDRIRDFKEGKMSSLRTRTEVNFPNLEESAAHDEQPTESPGKQALASPNESEQRPVNRPKAKLWLTQGLYAGQEFDPRVEKLSKSAGRRPSAQKRSILPLPMFAGARMLELGRDFRLPFDVFSPLPPAQPKPDEWKKTHKNIFIGEAANVWKKTKSGESSTCVCKPEGGCGEDCFNRSMFYECDDTNCTIGAEFCTNRSFEDLRQRHKRGGRYNIGVEVVKTRDRGYGVRSNRCFEPNQIIVEYTGEIITQDECDDRMNKRYKDSKCYYLMQFDQQMILDATRGSIARFVNHSCEPNCGMIKWTVAGKPRVALFAGDAGIMTGEEMTYDYNFNPYSVKNLEICRCGTPSCRGFLGPKPKETKDPLAGNKRYSQKALEGAAEKTANKKRKSDMPSSVTGSKRNFQKAFQDSVESLTKKRKIGIPSSVKKGFVAARAQTEKHLRKVYPASTSAERKVMRPVGGSFSMPLSRDGGAERTESTKTTVDKLKKTGIITYLSPRRSLLREKGGAANEEKAAEGSSKDGKVMGYSEKDAQSQGPSMKENLVRTVRRSGRGDGLSRGKSIRVIGDEAE